MQRDTYLKVVKANNIALLHFQKIFSYLCLKYVATTLAEYIPLTKINLHIFLITVKLTVYCITFTGPTGKLYSKEYLTT